MLKVINSILLLMLVSVFPVLAKEQHNTASTKYMGSEHILVTFADSGTGLKRSVGSSYKGYGVKSYQAPSTSRLLRRILTIDYPLVLVDDWRMQSLGIRCILYKLKPESSATEVLEKLQTDPRIESAQLMNNFETQATLHNADFSEIAYNDQYHDLQSSWKKLGLAKAHKIATGKGVKIAVVDTAVDNQHPDLQNSIGKQKSFLPPLLQSAGDRHGTAVAGVIASESGNQIGVVGVAPNAEVMALEACWRQQEQSICNTFTLAQALDYAIQQRVDIINLSLAGPEDPLLARLVNVALQRNIVVVAAISSQPELSFPASASGVIAVNQLDNGSKVSDSNKLGNSFDLKSIVLAPGREIITTVPNQSYDFVSGSSIATAHVSAMIALLHELRPAMTGDSLRSKLEKIAINIKTRAEYSTMRTVNACWLLADIVTDSVLESLECDPNIVSIY